MNNGTSRVAGRAGSQALAEASLHVRNIGGISESEITLDPGVNVLIGRNATNRTSHLQALMAVLGSDNVSIKSGAEEASVAMTLDGDEYTRTFTRREGAIQSSGEPLLDDPQLADLFAFLLRSNEARRAVVEGADLRELIMRPVDTDAIDSEIERTLREREEIDAKRSKRDELEKRLPSLQETLEGYRREIEELTERRESLNAEIDAADFDPAESKREQSELEAKLSELQSRRSALEDVRYRIETQETSIDSLREERAELEAEYESSSTPIQTINELGTDIDSLQARKERLDSAIDKVRNVIQFNQEMLEDDEVDHRAVLEPSSERAELPTDRLLPEDQQEVRCWTCGSNVKYDDVVSMLSELKGVSEEVMEMRRSTKSDLSTLRQQKKDIEAAQNRRDQIENKLARIEQELSNREESIEDLEVERESLLADIESIESEIEQAKDSNYDEVLELHSEANEVEFELDRLKREKRETEAEIERIESTIADYDNLDTKRQELSDRLTELRTRIDRIERSAVEGFNDHMDEILDLLEYENIARVWIERTETERSRGTDRSFDLHITRSTDSGTVHSDTVDNLSESEREVTGLVFALSGYLVHEVYETVPFMVLDSLEAVDSKRIATLVEYFEQYAGTIVVALLLEDARALDDDYNEIEIGA